MFVFLAAIAAGCGKSAVEQPNKSSSTNSLTTPTTTPPNSSGINNSPVPTNSYPADSMPANNKSASTIMPNFPFPPNASATYEIDSAWLRKADGQTTLGEVNLKLRKALRAGGYQTLGYYSVSSVNSGYVITTAVEQFLADGKPLTGPNRFTTTPTAPSLFSTDYLTNLIRGNQGRYRLIALMVNDKPFANNNEAPSFETTQNIASQGMNQLPEDIQSKPFSEKHYCTALIYEFRKDRGSGQVNFIRSSDVSAENHLQMLLKNIKESR